MSNCSTASASFTWKIPALKKNSGWYGLTTRNYVGSDDKTGYVDYRFVSIEPAEVI